MPLLSLTPQVNDRVYVGGCMGRIEKITENAVLVEGVYYYSDGEGPGWGEAWRFEYDRLGFQNHATLIYDSRRRFYDGTGMYWDVSNFKEYKW